MEYRSLADLAHCMAQNFHRLPGDIDLVVGIPRSGMLAANILALGRNLPLADLDGFVAGRVLGSGRTKEQGGLGLSAADARHVLVIDDSINSGQSMRAARDLVAAALPSRRVTYCAVYGRPDRPNADADIVMETVGWPRLFEWNLMHHKSLKDFCFDIDGVLCHDPSRDENDDGDAYLGFLAEARPLHLPTRPIGHLVTSRLEKYRAPTEAWLAAQGIRYGRLWMLDLPSAAMRRRLGAHGGFKAEVYARTGAVLFVESEPKQARHIAALTGKPVLSLPEQKIIQGGVADGRPVPWPKRAARKLLRTGTYGIHRLAARLG